jgi:O-antigen ligase
VALACVLALSVNERLGRALSILAGGGALMAFLALGFLGGRSMTIDESAASRIEAWSEGLIMLRSSPVWGVGFGMFTQHHVRVAHSSFVHCFAELGLVGYFLWLSLVVLTLDDMRCVARVELEGAGELRRWARALMLSLVGFLAGGVFLSRSYDVILFILLGVGVAIDDLARRSAGLPARGLLVRSFVVVAVEVTSILILWLYMRLLR